MNRPNGIIESPKRIFRLETIKKLLEISRCIEEKGISARIEMAIRELANDLAKSVYRSRDSFFELTHWNKSEIYLHSHTINVVILSLVIGSELTYSIDDLADLAMAAMLHDIGIPGLGLDRMNKAASLTERERQHVEKHPLLALATLNRWHRLSSAVKLGAYQHHEKYSGGGYPKGLRRFNIHEFARIIRIADTYEAMVSERPYRKPLSPARVMNYLLTKANDEFDPHLVRKFLGRMSLFPPGSVVMLNTGEIARVLLANPDCPYLPVIRILRDAHNQPVPGSELINLRDQRKRVIKECIGGPAVENQLNSQQG